MAINSDIVMTTFHCRRISRQPEIPAGHFRQRHHSRTVQDTEQTPAVLLRNIREKVSVLRISNKVVSIARALLYSIINHDLYPESVRS